MPATVNVSVIYYSATGTTQHMAERLAAAAEKSGAETGGHVEGVVRTDVHPPHHDCDGHGRGHPPPLGGKVGRDHRGHRRDEDHVTRREARA